LERVSKDEGSTSFFLYYVFFLAFLLSEERHEDKRLEVRASILQPPLLFVAFFFFFSPLFPPKSQRERMRVIDGSSANCPRPSPFFLFTFSLPSAVSIEMLVEARALAIDSATAPPSFFLPFVFPCPVRGRKVPRARASPSPLFGFSL